MKNASFIALLVISTLLFCTAIGFDISPYLRGPSYYPPEWRWEYLFENTLSRLYVPLLILACLGGLYYWAERTKKFGNKALWGFLFGAIVVFWVLQFGMLYFSRSGIGVLVHRIINPEINGYFTAALTIQSVPEFLQQYNTLMLEFVYHAKAHPPGAILLFYYIDQLMRLFPVFGEWATRQLPQTDDVRLIWDALQASEKATVFASAVIIPLLSATSMIPLYFTAKLLYGAKAAARSVALFAVIPSLLFFIPINDAFLHLFSITAFYFFVYGLQKAKPWFLTLAGVIMFIGILFNLSLLPILVLLFIYFLLHEFAIIKKQFWRVIKKGIYFLLGLFIPLLLLFVFFQFNFVEVTMTIMKHVPDVHTRSYVIWIFYNLYDFFVFTGLPVALIYFRSLSFRATNGSRGISYHRMLKKLRGMRSLHFGRDDVVDPLLVAFTCMILIVNFSGSVRAETGRIWIPYVPFMVLLAANFATNTLKFSTKQFGIILLLQVIQILVMQEFWVMLW